MKKLFTIIAIAVFICGFTPPEPSGIEIVDLQHFIVLEKNYTFEKFLDYVGCKKRHRNKVSKAILKTNNGSINLAYKGHFYVGFRPYFNGRNSTAILVG